MTGNMLKKMSLMVASVTAVGFMLAGCSDGTNGSNGTNGTNGKDLTSSVKVSQLTPEQWVALAPKIEVTGVTIASQPVVKYKVTDSKGNPIVGLSNASKSATATLAGLTNVAFTLAKLVPGTNGNPSKWVSYNVYREPTVAELAAAPTVKWYGTFPATDNKGTLVDNGDGSYQYTFLRDPKQAASIVAGLTDSADGLSKKADLGDVSFDATLTHRLGIQIGGAAPGTGSNTPNAVTVVPGVNMVNTGNAVFDFRPDGAAIVNTRDIVKLDSCSECHAGKVLAHGSRKDPRYCVTCHTDQIRYSFSQEASSANGGLLLTGTTRPTTAVVDGRALGDFPNMIHHIHMGEELVKQGYYFNASAEGKFNEVTYPQPHVNCVKCHDGSTTAVNKTTDGDNWNKVSSRLACGACHDGINFATGKGITLSGATTGHVGGAQTSDAACSLCHSAASIKVYHVTVSPLDDSNARVYHNNKPVNVASMLNPPSNVYKIALEIKQVTVTGAAGAKKANVVYRILKDGTPATLNATGNLITNVEGTPAIQLNFALPQDGVAKPADWTNNMSFTVTQFRDKAVVANGAQPGFAAQTAAALGQTGPDASGYYTATFSPVIPDAATMVTAALGINYDGFVQMNLPEYPNGVRLREQQFAIKTADGYTARRSIVSNAKCNACHGQLGVMPTFHNGARNNGEGCALCHNYSNSNATGHTGSAYSYGGGWSISAKDLVHSIHASSKREQAFSYEATADNMGGFKKVTYPGVLNNCEQCHVSGSYDFSAAANSAALPNLLWSTAAKADMTVPSTYTGAILGLSPWIPKPAGNYTGAIGAATRANNLVISPISAACFGCHDSTPAVAHMRLNGGVIYGQGLTTTFTSNPETCIVCHGSGKIADIKAVHSK